MARNKRQFTFLGRAKISVAFRAGTMKTNSSFDKLESSDKKIAKEIATLRDRNKEKSEI